MMLTGDGQAPAEALPHDTHPNVARAVEAARTTWNCAGTIWETHRPSDGRPTIHGFVDPNGAPDIHECRARIETTRLDGSGWQIIRAEGGFMPEEVDEDFMFDLAGGRKYRATLRLGANTVKFSTLNFDLRGRGEPKVLPQEEEEMRAAGKAVPEPQRTTATPTETDATMRMGADPTAAMLGSAIASIQDPTTKLLLAFALRDADRERALRLEIGARDERFFNVMTSTLGAQGRANGGDNGLTAYLKSEATANTARLAQIEAELRAAREERHKLELAAASKAEAPHPAFPLVAGVLEKAMTAGAIALANKVDAAAVTSIVTGVAAAAG